MENNGLKKIKKAALLLTLSLAACSPLDKIRTADLVFVLDKGKNADGARMEDAITLATGSRGLNVSHVGILEVAGGSVWVIDATPEHGVSRRPLESLKEDCSEDELLIVMRVNRLRDRKSVIRRAMSHAGKSYDFKYQPDDSELYCSELVQDAYRDKTDSPIFKSAPMNFKGPDGAFPEFWVKLFDSLGMEIPQGTEGTNPHDMFMTKRLEYVCTIK